MKGDEMSKENGLVLLEGSDGIEATGYITLGFVAKFESDFEDASPQEVGMEILHQIVESDLREVEVVNYRITGP